MDTDDTPKRGPKLGLQNEAVAVTDDAATIDRYNKAWPYRLEAGFDQGSVFFAWLMVATRPNDQWPDWCREYLVEVANRLLKKVSRSNSYFQGELELTGALGKRRFYPSFQLGDQRRGVRTTSIRRCIAQGRCARISQNMLPIIAYILEVRSVGPTHYPSDGQ